MVKVIIYSPQNKVEFEELEQFIDYFTSNQVISEKSYWIDFEGYPSVDEMSILSHIFGLHALTVDDILKTDSSAKYEIFEQYLFVVVLCTAHNEEYSEICIVLSDNFILSFHHDEVESIEQTYDSLNIFEKQSGVKKGGIEKIPQFVKTSKQSSSEKTANVNIDFFSGNTLKKPLMKENRISSPISGSSSSSADTPVDVDDLPYAVPPPNSPSPSPLVQHEPHTSSSISSTLALHHTMSLPPPLPSSSQTTFYNDDISAGVVERPDDKKRSKRATLLNVGKGRLIFRLEETTSHTSAASPEDYAGVDEEEEDERERRAARGGGSGGGVLQKGGGGVVSEIEIPGLEESAGEEEETNGNVSAGGSGSGSGGGVQQMLGLIPSMSVGGLGGGGGGSGGGGGGGGGLPSHLLHHKKKPGGNKPGGGRTHEHRLRAFSPQYILYALLNSLLVSFKRDVESAEVEVQSLFTLAHAIRSDVDQDDLLLRFDVSRRNIASIIHSLAPYRNVLSVLCTRRLALIDSETRRYIRSVFDLAVHLVDRAELSKDTLLNTHSNYLAYLSVQLSRFSNRINVIAKDLTLISAVFAIMNIIPSSWGMNIWCPGGVNPGSMVPWMVIVVTYLIVALIFYVVFRCIKFI